MTSETLLSKTYSLLDRCTLPYREIAEGAGVDINWFAKFKRRAIREPGVSKVQGIHDFLMTQQAASPVPKKGRRSVKVA